MQQDHQSLIDILHCGQRILDYVADCSLRDFYDDVQLQDAAIRRLLSMGKIAPRLSTQTRQSLHRIDWQAIDNMKSRLVPEEQSIDADHLWAIIQTEIPPLVQSLTQSLRSQVLNEDKETLFHQQESQV
jgi:uncharacterized protein with HEPN domain